MFALDFKRKTISHSKFGKIYNHLFPFQWNYSDMENK